MIVGCAEHKGTVLRGLDLRFFIKQLLLGTCFTPKIVAYNFEFDEIFYLKKLDSSVSMTSLSKKYLFFDKPHF
jgi:hypothetical protein